MMFASIIIRCILMIVLKLTEGIVFLISLIQYFKKPKRCPAITDDILLLPACTLAEQIRTKKITSETVVKKYISRINLVNPIINAVVQERFELAIKEAIHIDEMINQTTLSTEELATTFPLLGLPLTVKESIPVEGLSNCAGLTFPEGVRIATKDCDVVSSCRKAGAIPILVSNTAEACAYFETYNNVTGRTCNPYDSRRTPGGSSGGEASLLAAAASVIGIGSDLYGSLRLPAHYCGIWAHKPSANVICVDGHYPGSSDKVMWNDILTFGPMTRYAVDLPLVFNIMVKDEAKSHLQLQEQVYMKDLNIYYLDNNGGSILTHQVDSAIKNSIKTIVTHMNLVHGCKIEELPAKYFKYATEFSYLNMCNITNIEVIDEIGFKDLLMCRKSYSIFPLIMMCILRQILRGLFKTAIQKGVEEMANLKNELTQILGTNGVLIFPTLPAAAPVHGYSIGRFFDFGYIGIFNNIGFPATNCPVGLNSKGLPIGIQVIAARNNDRLTLAVAQEIEKVCGGWMAPPFEKE